TADKHGVGAFSRLNGEHAALHHDYGLPDVEMPERRDHAKTNFDVGAIVRRWRLVAKSSFRGKQLRGNLAGTAHAIALAFEKTHDAGQYLIVAPHAETEQEGQILDGTKIEPDIGEVGPRNRADDHEIPATQALKGGEQLADFAPFQPGMGEARYLRVSLSANADNVNGASLYCRSVGERGGKRAAAGDDGKRTSLASRGAGLSLGRAQLSFGSALGHCCSGHRMSDRSAT